MVSFSKWEKLIARRMEKTVVCVVSRERAAADAWGIDCDMLFQLYKKISDHLMFNGRINRLRAGSE